MLLQLNKSISQRQTKKQPNCNLTFMHKLNVPKTNVILTLLKICCFTKRNVTMTKIKCNCKVVYIRNPDVPQKALSEHSHFLYYWREP